MSDDQTPIKVAVFYCDGAARHEDGASGYGIHAYFHNNEISTKGIGAKLTPAKKGYLTSKSKEEHIEIIHFLDIRAPLPQGSSSNLAELSAMIDVFETIERIPIEFENQALESVYVYSDSQYVVKGLNQWAKSWRKNNWVNSKGEQIANVDLWKKAFELFERIQQTLDIEINWLRGHSDDLGNHLAHVNAQRGMALGYKGLEPEYRFSLAKGYFKPKAEFNRLLCKTSWYFQTNLPNRILSNDQRYVYYLGKHGGDDNFLGKPRADSSFAVVFLEEPDPVLETISAYQTQTSADYNQDLFIGRLNRIMQAPIYSEILEYGDRYLIQRPHSRDLLSPEAVELTRDHKPAKLAFRASELLQSLHMDLEKFISGELANSAKVSITEITDAIYFDEEQKSGKYKRKIHPELDTSTRFIDIKAGYYPLESSEVKYAKLRLLLDIDLPSRNALAAIADMSTQVYVITYPYSEKAHLYHTVVVTEKDIALFSSGFSNIWMSQ